ncbi:MAG TPA: MFS transporter [Actinomycetota bacterium]|nr:MFS transporter [Actinomycetota bacterium]
MRYRGRWWALAALALSGLVVGIDATVLNLALPTLATTLRASTPQLQWFVDAYSLAMAAMLLPAGLLGDRFGRKRLLLFALVAFSAASLASAYAPTAGWLIASRAVLGLAAAFIVPLSLSVLTVLFSDEERPKAITALVAMTIVAFPIGPILGGWLLTNYWWGSVFLINVPVVVVALVAVGMLLPESRGEERPGVDLVGIALSSAGLAAFTYGVIEGGQSGWLTPKALAFTLAGATLVATFVAWERRCASRGAQPLIDLELFRSPGFTWGTILVTVVQFAMFGLLFTVPQYFQAVGGIDAFGTGLRLLPMVLGLIVGAVVANKFGASSGEGTGLAQTEAKGNAKVTVAIGFALIAAGLAVGATTSVASGYGFAAVWIVLVGAGLGFAMPAAMSAALGALTPARSGVGSGLIQAIRQVGGTFGVAVLGSVLDWTYRARVPVGHLPPAVGEAVRGSASAGAAIAHRIGSEALLASVRTAFVQAMDVMLWLCAGIALVGTALALWFLPRHPASANMGANEGTEGEVAVSR